jgi:hypothetical protein
VLLSLITSCNQQNTTNNKFVVYAHHENMNDELRKSLFKCLNTEKIEYQVDSDKNVLIKKKNIDHAVVHCS